MHITKHFIISQNPSHNFTSQQVVRPIVLNPNSFDKVKHIFQEYELLHNIRKN